MNSFEILKPANLDSAMRLLARPHHAALAGGVDLLDLLKQRIEEPRALVDLNEIAELQGIERTADGGLRLGALARLGDVAAHPWVRELFAAIAEAAGEAATPQIRNLATVGGNLLQRPRCWYFRNPEIVCLKKGGHTCYALNGLNRYHAILGGGPSFIVHPSNLAPALIAFDATVRIAGPDGKRSLVLDQFFTLPSMDATRENVLGTGEIIIDVIVPPPAASAGSAYLEVREKQSFDWPLVSAAAVLETGSSSNEVRRARVVLGAVAPVPWRSREAEHALIGAVLNRTRAESAAEQALKGARPLPHNAYKVAIARALVRRSVLHAGRVEEACDG
jgi:xanthine dehydrogenase YagS FAD-binding subunit